MTSAAPAAHPRELRAWSRVRNAPSSPRAGKSHFPIFHQLPVDWLSFGWRLFPPCCLSLLSSRWESHHFSLGNSHLEANKESSPGNSRDFSAPSSGSRRGNVSGKGRKVRPKHNFINPSFFRGFSQRKSFKICSPTVAGPSIPI